MWFEQAASEQRWTPAIRHLKKVDSKLARVIDRVGICTLAPRRDYFVVLCKAIYTQQISTKVAAILFGRFRDQFPARRPTPDLVLKFLLAEDAALKGCGLSRQKRKYLQDLARHFSQGLIQTRKISRLSDEQVIETLVRVNGVGRWTAEMFLIFVLNRPDVLPVDDLGLRVAAQRLYGLAERPRAAELTELAEKWRPWRSVATWYLWRSEGAGRAAEKAAAKKIRKPPR